MTRSLQHTRPSGLNPSTTLVYGSCIHSMSVPTQTHGKTRAKVHSTRIAEWRADHKQEDQGVQENTHERRPQVRLRGARDGGQVSRPHAEVTQVLEKHSLARAVEGAIAHASLQIPADPRDDRVHSEETRRVLQQRRIFLRGQTERDQLVHTYFTEPRALSEAA
eukprot:scaffold73593_cov81-Phaeocystis_antarctica.AAC.2